MRRVLGIFLLLLTAASTAEASWAFDKNIETFFEYLRQQVRDTNTNNPGNSVLALPVNTENFEIRPDFKLSGNTTKVIFRPQFSLQNYTVDKSNPTSEKNYAMGIGQINDLYVEQLFGDNWTTAVGMQVYQWGPAELLNPSNPIFNFGRQQRGLYYKEKGQVLARVNYAPNQNWSLLGMYEPMTNAEPEPRAGEKYTQKGLLKLEWRSDSSLNYLGGVVGKEHEDRNFFGEYINLTPFDGISFYADARHTKGYKAWIPVKTTLGFFQMRDDVVYDQESYYTLATVGFRWEGRNDFRIEYIYNEPGWTGDEFKDAYTSISTLSPYLPANLGAFSRPGFDLLTESYLYSSLRIPDLGKKQDITVYFFDVHSLTDQSGIFQGAIEKPWNDALTMYGEVGVNYGDDNTEFKLLTDYTARAGLRLAF